MDFVPPLSVRRVGGDPQFVRFIVRDGGGHYWTGTEWSDSPSEAMLYLRESEAMRAGIEADKGTETFVAHVLVSVTRDAWLNSDNYFSGLTTIRIPG